MTARSTRLWLAAGALAVAGCVTVNVYFPEAEVKDLAQQIEEEVRETAKTEGGGAPAKDDDGSVDQLRQRRGSVSLLDLVFGVTPAYAQSVPEPEVTNPAIRKIIESRAARLAELNRDKAAGVVGENKDGLVEVRNLESLTDLRERAEVQKIVRAENADREQLYKEIAAAKNIDMSQLPRVRETYAETLRSFARPGEWIQMPDGEWREK